MKINSVDENRLNLTCLMEVIPKAEETLAQKTHCSVERTSEGSIIILLQTETGDAVEKLRQFIENGDISNFLKQLFESKDGRKLLKKDKYTIQIEIKKVQSSATGKTMHVNKVFFFVINQFNFSPSRDGGAFHSVIYLEMI